MRNAYNIIYILLALLFLSGCRTKREVVRVVTEYHDTIRVEGVRLDSVFVHDSVSVFIKGDTIKETRWRVEYRDRWRDVVRDVVREVHDTTTVQKTIEVRKPPTIIDRAKDVLLIIFGFFIMAFIGFRVIRGAS